MVKSRFSPYKFLKQIYRRTPHKIYRVVLQFISAAIQFCLRTSLLYQPSNYDLFKSLNPGSASFALGRKSKMSEFELQAVSFDGCTTTAHNTTPKPLAVSAAIDSTRRLKFQTKITFKGGHTMAQNSLRCQTSM